MPHFSSVGIKEELLLPYKYSYQCEYLNNICAALLPFYSWLDITEPVYLKGTYYTYTHHLYNSHVLFFLILNVNKKKPKTQKSRWIIGLKIVPDANGPWHSRFTVVFLTSASMGSSEFSSSVSSSSTVSCTCPRFLKNITWESNRTDSLRHFSNEK